MSGEDQILKELEKISKILLLVNGDKLESELNKICSTNDRKKIWVLIDKKMNPEDISKQAEILIGTVRNFITMLEKAELVENVYGKPPVKMIDYIPPKWVELLKNTKNKAKDTDPERSE